MFDSSRLETIHTGLLPATTLAPYCYLSMFADCWLKTIPWSLLPAQTLANNCYESMFVDNYSVDEAPRLPAQTLADNCYKHMFQGCNKLASVSFHGKTIGLQWTLGWLEGVSKTGNFNYSYKWLKIERGDYAVPFDWNINAPS